MHRLKSLLGLAIVVSGLLSGCGGGIQEGTPPNVGYVPPGPDEGATPPTPKGTAPHK